MPNKEYPVKCCKEACGVIGHIDLNETPENWDGKWFCSAHRLQRKASDNGPKPIVSQDASISIEPTPELNKAFGIEPSNPDMKEALIQKQAEALDRATYAFEFIINLGCDCGRKTEADPHRPLCRVLAAQNGLDNIKAALGES